MRPAGDLCQRRSDRQLNRTVPALGYIMHDVSLAHKVRAVDLRLRSLNDIDAICPHIFGLLDQRLTYEDQAQPRARGTSLCYSLGRGAYMCTATLCP